MNKNHGRTFKAYHQRQPWKKYKKSKNVCWCGLRFDLIPDLINHKAIGHK